MSDKGEYHRGYVDGCRHRETATWQLDQERAEVAARLRDVEFEWGSFTNLSAICDAIHHSEWGWTMGACEHLREKLIRLMGGDADSSNPRETTNKGGETDPNLMEFGENHKYECNPESDMLPLDAVVFARRVEEAASNREDVTLFGVDYVPAFRDSAESIVHDLLLGTVTPTQAIGRIGALRGEESEGKR